MTNPSLPDTLRQVREAFDGLNANLTASTTRVTGYSDLDDLPIGTVVRTGPASTWERMRPGRLGWWSTGGAHDDFPAIDNRTVQVLYLPGQS